MQKVCPRCKSKQVKVRRAVYSIAEVDFVDGKFVYNVIEDESEAIEVYECANCGEQINEADLVNDTVECPKCGREVPADKIVDGSCDICKLFEEQPDLENMSVEDILRNYVISKADAKTKKITKSIEEKAAKVESVEEPTKKKVTRKKKEEELPHVDVDVTEYKKEEPKQEEEPVKEEPKADEPPLPNINDFLVKPTEEKEEEPKETEGYQMFDPNKVVI